MLRVRLVLWYAFLVVLTVAAVGAVQYAILKQSLTSGLDQSLVDDARSTLRLVKGRSAVQLTHMHTRPHTNQGHETLKDLVDDALKDAPDTLQGDELTDRVLSSLMDEMLLEIAGKDSNAADPLDLIVERNLASRRNNLVEIVTDILDSTGQPTTIFRTKNLGTHSLRKIFAGKLERVTDSVIALGSEMIDSDNVRAAYAGSKQFGVIIAYTTSDIKESTTDLLQTYAYMLPVALVVASLGGLVLSRKALRPIEEIAETAQEISAKNLSRRIAMPARQDKELNLLVATLNTMFSRLEHSFEQIEQFSSDASHELKTPLAILRGEIEQTQRRITSSDVLHRAEAEGLLGSMTEEVERMQRIVESLLLLAKADDRHLSLELERVDLSDFLRSISEDAEILANDRGLGFHSIIPGEQIFVSADRTRLYQVMMNLLDNALKYTPHGGDVTIFLEKNNGRALFGITDTGKGIAAEEYEKIFQRFYRSEEARSHQGDEYVARSLGLGLALVKSIVEAHGGTIAIESEIGKGSKFIVSMPMV
ncbi:MAG TPA: ATP-binding protein [Candidatus Kapabacteria bacterium]|nr:ATP-binding protein [Candidatus Kapabacteria bacterium]